MAAAPNHSRFLEVVKGDDEEGERRAAFLTRRFKDIRQNYKQRKWTEAQRVESIQKEMEELAQKESNPNVKILYQMGANMMKSSRLQQQQVKQEGSSSNRRPANKTASWRVHDSQYGWINLTSEGSRHWRKATISETKNTIVLCNDEMEGCLFFGRFLQVKPTKEGVVAVVYKQDHAGSWRSECSENGFSFQDIQVVPDAVLRQVRNEAPPGKFFSGRTDTSTTAWAPAPPGQVWFTSIGPNPPPTYLDDESYRIFQQRILPMGRRCGIYKEDERVTRNMKEAFDCYVWCPVVLRFLSEPEMFRSRYWFHNGDGSAQQRYYYNQNEMLQKEGCGMQMVPLRARYVPSPSPPNWPGTIEVEYEENHSSAYHPTNEEPTEVRTRTLDQILQERTEEAERSGKMIRLE